jgi:multiple sugar transport system ATP-binding protein
MTLVAATVEANGAGPALVVGEQRLAVAAEAVRRHPALGRDSGRRVVVGIRPEHMQPRGASGDDSGSLRGRVALVEPLGPQQLVHVEIDAEPVVSDAVLEIAGDGDADAGRANRREGSGVRAVATFDARVPVGVGAQIDLSIPTEELHYFDPDTGMALRG